MFRLSVILAAAHFALAFGLRCGFRRLAQVDSDFARACSDFAEKIEFVLTQPGRALCDALHWAEGTPGFWVLFAATSILWGNVLSFLIRRVFSALFR